MQLLHIYPEQLQLIDSLLSQSGITIDRAVSERKQKLLEIWLREQTDWQEGSFCVANAVFSDGSSAIAIDYPTHLSQEEGQATVLNLLSSLNSGKSLSLPRCKHCKYFLPSSSKKMLGRCARNSYTPEQMKILNIDLIVTATSNDYKPGILNVSPNFGCVLYEEKNNE